LYGLDVRVLGSMKLRTMVRPFRDSGLSSMGGRWGRGFARLDLFARLGSGARASPWCSRLSTPWLPTALPMTPGAALTVSGSPLFLAAAVACAPGSAATCALSSCALSLAFLSAEAAMTWVSMLAPERRGDKGEGGGALK
jgi:hypothetical protein